MRYIKTFAVQLLNEQIKHRLCKTLRIVSFTVLQALQLPVTSHYSAVRFSKMDLCTNSSWRGL